MIAQQRAPHLYRRRLRRAIALYRLQLLQPIRCQ
eukprot:COSAG01_NODE_55295_length_326_cov_0.682819_2_plen_33_part_01